MNRAWLKEYFDLYKKPLFDESIPDLLLELKQYLETVHRNGKKTMILGNGGSAAISSHVAVDFSKNANIRMVNFNEADLITCLANDYGYEYWMAKAIEIYGDEGDQVILISSSGSSSNVVNAAKTSKEKGYKVITFTGFDENNPLKSSGDLNFWVNSRAYNIVEMVHHIWLLAVCDAVIGVAEYPAS
ncbi:MAG: SIS domain-containing protein [Candidatus Marinimicrobia bacterium]|jgi:D-sedoheptulose 7-phosphate isomerase|nr:SIS domain-containing protein [Candidatus Neomarinimicrobiota bacterium]